MRWHQVGCECVTIPLALASSPPPSAYHVSSVTHRHTPTTISQVTPQSCPVDTFYILGLFKRNPGKRILPRSPPYAVESRVKPSTGYLRTLQLQGSKASEKIYLKEMNVFLAQGREKIQSKIFCKENFRKVDLTINAVECVIRRISAGGGISRDNLTRSLESTTWILRLEKIRMYIKNNNGSGMRRCIFYLKTLKGSQSCKSLSRYR
ncbi:unnamed protein product [Lactuca virosa]|uniref:Uncharacterized protein n=1 Tax=Lactuca virosa TaxID=75947 RepID=A0AAU9PXD8_9ASTR|nr:unnamed protein product [Lactuca virosa]